MLSKNFNEFLKKINLLHSFIYIIKNKYFYNQRIKFFKTLSWLNEKKDDTFLMVSLPRTGQNFFLDIISDYCKNFKYKNVNFEKEILNQQFIVHDNLDFYKFKSNLHISVDAGYKGYKRINLKKLIDLPLTHFAHLNVNKYSVPGVDKRYKDSIKIILLRNVISSLFSWFKMMSGRFPNRYNDFRDFLDVGHLQFAIKFYNSWKYEILNSNKSIILFYEDISNDNKKFEIFKSTFFKMFGKIDEEKLRISLTKFDLDKIKLELNKNEYGSKFSYKGSNDYSKEISHEDLIYIQTKIKDKLNTDLYNFFSKKKLL